MATQPALPHDVAKPNGSATEQLPLPVPPIAPPIRRVGISGLYTPSAPPVLDPGGYTPHPDEPLPRPPGGGPLPERPPLPWPRQPNLPLKPIPWRVHEELRLDVDGRYPQMVVSGSIRRLLSSTVSWIAGLEKTGDDQYAGTIFYTEPSPAPSSFPYTTVEVTVQRASIGSAGHRAIVRFGTANGQVTTRHYAFSSPSFHKVDFEFDSAEGEAATVSIDTHAHPNRPATLQQETLTAEKVYRRAGFDVTVSPGGPVPIAGAGTNAQWSDQEMHDAMQAYWSRFTNSAQWAMWVFFASLHEQGTGLGGIMFDDIGSQHRQGTAIFNDAFISQPPPNDPAPDAWVQRMIFWTAIHEMGHGFNLAHSWQKHLGTPWVPLTSDNEVRSFMNYPYRVAGSTSAFYADFEYRFSDQELLFLRHAPSRFVQMGNQAWFDHHGFEGASVSPAPSLALELRVNRERPLFEFMEPVRLEAKLTNVSGEPLIVDENDLALDGNLMVGVRRSGQSGTLLHPIAHRCQAPAKRVLAPGESIYRPVFASAGSHGWNIDEPGVYVIQAALSQEGEDVVSNELRVRVAPPRGYEEELVAQEYFTEDVGRVLGLRGSAELTGATDTLREVAERLPQTRAAIHAADALGAVATRSYKRLVEAPDSPRGIGIAVRPPEPEAGRQLLGGALLERPTEAAESLGHIAYKARVDRFSDWLAETGDAESARASQDRLLETLTTREVGGRPVLESVIEDVKSRRDSY